MYVPLSAIDARFESTRRARGGLAIVGLPLTGPITLDNGLVVQYFERARFQFHPKNRGTRYAILLDLLSVELGHLGVAALEAAARRWSIGRIT